MAKRKKETTMQDIADFLGISKNSVSIALGDKPGVGEKLRQKIKETARQMNYIGMKALSAKNQNIMVLTPNYISHDTRYYYQIFWAIEKQAKLYNYNTIMTGVSTEMEENNQLPSIYYEFPLNGIIIVGVFKTHYLEKIKETNLPVIITDTYDYSVEFPSVVTANMEGMYNLVNYLIQIGHKDIGFIGPIARTSSFFDRWRGYASAMQFHNLKIDNNLCFLEEQTLEHLAEKEETEHVINRITSLPSAFVCANDIIAISLIKAYQERNIKIPGDISIAGFDDIEAASLIIPSLTTVKVKRTLIGKKSVELLLHQINQNEQNNEKIVVSVYGELLIRDSVAPVK